MEHGKLQINSNEIKSNSISDFDTDRENVNQRLEIILETNAATAREKSNHFSEMEKREALIMKNPLSIQKTFAYFGLLLGTFPPTAFFTRFFLDIRLFQSDDVWILGIFAVVNLISAIVGFYSGKYIGKLVFELEKTSWSQMLFTLPFIGIFWGMMAGGAGGIIIFGVGAFFGALLGSLVGAAALPIFSIFHRLFKQTDKIENKYFLPFSVGTTAIICAFILGL